MKNTSRIGSLIGILVFAWASLTAQPSDSLNIMIGQMILIGVPGTQVDQLVLGEVRSGKVGSIILFEKNIPKSASAFAPLKKVIWTYQQAAPIPLLVAIDQEGGKVNRLKEKYGFTRSITAQDMGRAQSLDSVRFYAEATAATLAGLGINVNFAPVVDLGVNKENTVIYKVGRSFSAKPDSVAVLAGEFIRMHRKFGVITVLKHFPGHGSSLADTHFGVADVTNTWTAAELVPYELLIQAGDADAVMSAHIVNRQLDPGGFPGTLSTRMIDSLLRKKLQYNGVVFSDDMQMQAIAKQYGLEESIKRAINAGIDVLCFSNNIQGSEERTVDKVHGIIRGLVQSGQIKQERIHEAYNRIMRLKGGTTLAGRTSVRMDSLNPQPDPPVQQQKEAGTGHEKMEGKKKRKKS
ncbi:MAG: glycoside hydrolase family 3 N-terminal domain-containing protein [Cytophagales bacterium]|nr:glycoside hydrolase family 3 N-terminal domain-containing protein [Cytophagales bacterium]